jgi:alkanesulfonate monooxygenase SsuD/methylene tetrahydromethanopterin reductase-like flavin-dependent oxidoreductase (luciferase family)
MIRRNGMTVPLPGHLHAQRDKLVQLADWGYSDIWSAETDGADAFTPLALAAAWEPRLRLGTAIVPAYTRTAPVIAQSVAAMADAAPGRFAIGIGSSSNVIVENGTAFRSWIHTKKFAMSFDSCTMRSAAKRSPRNMKHSKLMVFV